MNSSLLLRAIPAIRGGSYPLNEFLHVAALGEHVAADLLRFLARNGIGTLYSGTVRFEAVDKMRTAMLALRLHADIESVAKTLSWRDFEILASSTLEASGYETYHSFRLRKPRAEIDVVGIRDGMALLLDCKHWQHSSPSVLRQFALKQSRRAVLFLQSSRDALKFAVPALLTLHAETLSFADGVPVVPIVKFRSFLDEMHGYLDRIRKVTI